MIVVVPDDDLLNFINGRQYRSGISIEIGKVLDWLMKEHNRVIEIQKDFLPAKSKRVNYPHFVWIEPPIHRNFNNKFMREKFVRCLHTAADLHDNVSVLKLKKIWDDSDNALFNKKSQCYTANGLNTSWEAVDCTLKFCDSTILKGIAKQEIKVKGQGDAPTFECKEFNEKMPSADSRNDYQDHWKDERRRGSSFDRFHWKHH